jgi:hypothetical protein
VDGKQYNDFCSADLNNDMGCATYKVGYSVGWNAAGLLYGGPDNSRYYDDDDDDDYNRYNHNGYQREIELTVRIVGEKYNMPDFKIKAGQDSTIAYGNEFEDDGKAKVRLNIDDSTQKVCISTVNTDVSFKKCKQITSDEITFTLR